MLEGLTGVMTGRPFHGETIVHVAVVFLFVILILAAIREMKTRLAIFYLVILPIALSFFISFVIKSMFKPRIMSFTVPFISLGLATGFWHVQKFPREQRMYLVGLSVATILTASIFVVGNMSVAAYRGHHDFARASKVLRAALHRAITYSFSDPSPFGV